MPPAARRVTAEYPPTRQAASTARELVADACTAWGLGHICDDAQVVVTELVANAVRHAGTSVTVTVHRVDHGIRLEVVDQSKRPLLRRDVDLLAEGGRGLLLVDALTTSWSVEADQHGKRVVADLSAVR